MVQSLAATTVTSIAIGVASVCAPARVDEATRADTAFVLMGTSPDGLTKPGATALEFKREARYCLDRAADTRAEPPDATGPEVPFRTFSGCMEGLGWRKPPAGSRTRLVRPHETLPEEFEFSSL